MGKRTREEVRAICDRARLRIEKYGLGTTPITDKQRTRFQELKAAHSATQVAEAAVESNGG